MLVLLIVFMVTAPLTVGIPVDLPKTRAGQISANAAPLVVSIQEGGEIYLQDNAIAEEQLIPRLTAVSEANPDVRIFVRGDRAVSYGEVVELMVVFKQLALSVSPWSRNYQMRVSVTRTKVDKVLYESFCTDICGFHALVVTAMTISWPSFDNSDLNDDQLVIIDIVDVAELKIIASAPRCAAR